jgi:opacity protein-like surface antigen
MKCQACKTIAYAALSGLFTAQALAAEAGFYLTAGLGHAEEEPKSIGTTVFVSFPFSPGVHLDPDRVNVDSNGAAWSTGIGYRLNPYFAAEVEYIDFGSTDVSEHYSLGPPLSPPLPAEITKSFSSKVTGPALSVLGSVHVNERMDVFLRAGALFADRKVENPDFPGFNDKFGSTVWLAGVGVNWSATNRWALRVEYQRTGKLDQTLIAGETELERVSLNALFAL